VYVFGRRIHHGEIGALLPLFLLFVKLPVPAASILAGLEAGLVKDDLLILISGLDLKKQRSAMLSTIAKDIVFLFVEYQQLIECIN
jgi:hypothetical protein